jgi:hypothetical protein
MQIIRNTTNAQAKKQPNSTTKFELIRKMNVKRTLRGLIGNKSEQHVVTDTDADNNTPPTRRANDANMKYNTRASSPQQRTAHDRISCNADCTLHPLI